MDKRQTVLAWLLTLVLALQGAAMAAMMSPAHAMHGDYGVCTALSEAGDAFADHGGHDDHRGHNHEHHHHGHHHGAHSPDLDACGTADHGPSHNMDECPVCALCKTPGLAVPMDAGRSVELQPTVSVGFARAEALGPIVRTGPPVGLRAPPVSI
jgi:hypothetical protein